jgi:potassium-dependent mechanosensitive channel
MTAFQHWISRPCRCSTPTVWSERRARFIQSMLVVCACAVADVGAQGILKAFPPASAQAQGPQSKGALEQSDASDAAKKLLEARAELQGTSAHADTSAGVAQSELIERRIILGRLVGAYARQVQNADALALAERNRAELEKQASSWSGFAQPGPYSVFLVDSLRSALQAATLQAASSQTRQSIILEQMEAAHRELAEQDENLRQMQERLEHDGSGPQIHALTVSRDTGVVRRRLAAAVLAASDAESKVASAEAAGYRAQAELLRKQLAIASKNILFTQAELDKVLAHFNQQQASLEQELQHAQVRRDAAHRALDDAQSAAPRGRGMQRRDSSSVADIAELRDVEARNSDLAVQLSRLKLDACTQGRAAWQYRLFLTNARDREKLRAAYAGLEQALQSLSAWARYIDGEIALTTVQIGEQERRVRAAEAPGEIARLAELQRAFEQRSALYHDAKEIVASLMNTLTLWRQQFDEDRAVRTLSARASDAAGGLRDTAATIWNFELFNADDTVEVDGRKITAKRSVTVGKSIGAVLLLVLGYFVSAWLMRRLELELIRRFHVQTAVAQILRRWGEFAVLALLFVFALNLVKIPLTVFAFLGGALAIGIGFGAQNLLKNLMSGIILLIERPLRVGDIVEMGATLGSVTNISIRASTVRSGNGVETLIPNSSFLENVVTNWTYSDRRVRREIKVTVPRSASTRQLSDLLLATARRHGELLKEPAPRVLLQDLGIDNLTFVLQYWTELRGGLDADMISSDLRFMIETALKDADLSKRETPGPDTDGGVSQVVA